MQFRVSIKLLSRRRLEVFGLMTTDLIRLLLKQHELQDPINPTEVNLFSERSMEKSSLPSKAPSGKKTSIKN